MLLFSVLAFCLLRVRAAPAGWDAGPDFVFGKPEDGKFDYVVVGGGTAGLTVAARLAENRQITVAVIEAGDFYENVNGNQSTVPAYGGTVSTPAVDWGFKTTPQAALNNRQLPYSRGKTVGGSSATNLMAYHRGTKSSYKQWADAVGDDSFTFEGLLPYFQKSVKFTPPNMSIRPANASVPAASANSYSSTGGPLEVTHTNWADVVATYGESAYKEIGLASIPDLTSGKLIGNQYSPATVRASDQTRSSSESSFWQAAVKAAAKDRRQNLQLHHKTLAKKVLFDKSKKATGVEVDRDGKKYTLKASREVILAAGAFQSPQLLMVSGVGPKAKLDEFKIPVIADRAGVGQNMQDHLFFSVINEVSVLTLAATLTEPWISVAPKLYNTNATGILAHTGADYFAWERVTEAAMKDLPTAVQNDLKAVPSDWPHYEIVIGDLPFKAGSNYAEFIGMLSAPLGRGSISISSNDMKDPPVINTNTFSHPTDQAVAMALFKRIRALTSTKAMKPIMVAEVSPGPAVQTDKEIQDFLVHNEFGIGPGYHASCSCAMGKPDDPKAVVDTKGQVIGVKGLRVVDASAFNLLPPGHLLSTVYALAEKFADDIKKAQQGYGYGR